MAYQPDPPIPDKVMTGVKMFGVAFALWLICNVTFHALLWYRVIPDLRAVPRSCGPSPIDAAPSPNWPHVTKKLFGPEAGQVVQDPTAKRLFERDQPESVSK